MSIDTVPPARASAPPARSAALLELIQGSITTQALAVAATLGVADALRAGPLCPAQLGPRVGAHPDALRRTLRLLASRGVFAELDDGAFTLTEAAQCLRSDVPDSMLGMALLTGHPIHWEEWSHLLDSVRSGEPCAQALHGMDEFSFLGSQPEYGGVFYHGMTNLSEVETAPILAAYDFSRFRTVVDFGGGRGGLLAAILAGAPRTRGVLFDERAEMFGAQELFTGAGVADRCTIDPGGLFDTVTPGADSYVLKHIVHDWPEDRALTILRNVRAAIADDGLLQIIEFVPPADNGPHPGKLTDLMLMLLVGGRERTGPEYAQLLDAAGFEVQRIVPTSASVSVVEARPRPGAPA
jgi:hypothetical protein